MINVIKMYTNTSRSGLSGEIMIMVGFQNLWHGELYLTWQPWYQQADSCFLRFRGKTQLGQNGKILHTSQCYAEKFCGITVSV